MERLLTNPMRYLKETVAGVTKYALGKGVVSLGVMVATFVSGGTALGAVWPVIAGFMAWKMYRLFDNYTGYKDRMLNLYRDEIAQQMGIEPAQVTRDHLRLMARGDALLGIEPNGIIQQALDRQRGTALLSFCTALLSAGVTLTLLTLGLDTMSAFLSEHFKDLGEFARKASVATISGLSGLIVHNGLDAVVGQSLGYFRATAHDRIALIARQKDYGVKVTPQQVFDVFMAANPEFAQQVSRSFNKGMTGFTNAEKIAAMKAIGVFDSMQELAEQINTGALKPGTLAFELDSTSAMHSLQKVRHSGYDRSSPQQQNGLEAIPENPQPKRFTERFAPHDAHASFVEAETARREQHAHRQHHSI